MHSRRRYICIENKPKSEETALPLSSFLKGMIMCGLFPPARFRRAFVARLVLAFCPIALATGSLPAQSTFGVILGTVRDSSGALVQGAQVTLVNTGTAAMRAMATDESGSYAFKNIDVGNYALTFAAPNFEKESLPEIGRAHV